MRASFAAALALLAGCASTATTPPSCHPGHALVNATLWMQSAAESRASALQTYAAARAALDAALAAPPAALPPAIILDLDETALDNTGYATRSIRRDTTFQFDANWSAWVAEAPSRAIPGSVDFLNYAISRGVTLFYITNRTADMEADTRRNLATLGIPISPGDDTVLLRGERPEWNTTDKTTRRDFVAARYHVILLMGDDLNDFTGAGGKSAAEREAITNAGPWGTRWFVVANPMYGSWENAATGGGAVGCEQLGRKVDALRE